MDRVGGVLVETYRIERLIAEGSMGSVFEARHVRIPKRFAVKFLRVGLEDNAEAMQRFRREAEVVATLEHPNIVGLYDYNVGADGVPYIVLEYLDGEPLSARLERQPRIALGEALRIVTAVGSALTAAHAREVIHRDLKPENIVLCAGDVVKVVDFGVAKLRGAPDLTAVNTIVGTVPYMSPEQLMGNASDPRVDQYALATIAYEMLAGEMAFDGSGQLADVARRVLTHSPPFVAGVSQALNEVIFRGMARNAAERFSSVDAFVTAFVAAAQTTGDAALPEAQPELPPLAGEATRITTSGDAAAVRDDDDDDPVAPPPEQVLIKGPTLEMPVVPREEPGAPAALPAINTLVVERMGHPAPLLEEPRVTLKTMNAVTDPSLNAVTDKSMPAVSAESFDAVTNKSFDAVTNRSLAAAWDGVAVDATRQSPAVAPRMRWILVGAALGLVVALGFALLFLR